MPEEDLQELVRSLIFPSASLMRAFSRQTVKLIVIDKVVESMIIMNFSGATENFFDTEFDGESAIILGKYVDLQN